MSEFDLEPILSALRPSLGEAYGEPVALSGGITNRNLLVSFEAGDFVLRICTPGVEIISIDRETEVQANRNAHEAGVAPAVAAWLPDLGCLVTEFVPGDPMTPETMADPERKTPGRFAAPAITEASSFVLFTRLSRISRLYEFDQRLSPIPAPDKWMIASAWPTSCASMTPRAGSHCDSPAFALRRTSRVTSWPREER